MSKSKAGKAKKKQAPKARRAAPKAAKAVVNDAPAAEIVIEPGKTVAVISKGSERLPVQLRDQAHLDELIETHGRANVVVQP